MERIKTIAVLSSGGDAPGMNAGIRAVVRAAINNGLSVKGVLHGYEGLIHGEFKEMNKVSVSNIINIGGTILFTARSKEFMQESGQKKALDNLCKENVDALVVLGGDGSFRGAYELSKLGMPVIGIPATIDLDIACTEYTIGFDTAINTAMECIDKLRDTSSSHLRCSVIEVMGRNAGFIASYSGISTGAEEILIPEDIDFANLDSIITRVKIGMKKGKTHYMIIVAEGMSKHLGGTVDIAKRIEDATGVETRPTVLGYVQRGGSPTCRDRVMASMMGVHAIKCLLKGDVNKIVILKDGIVKDIDIKAGIEIKRVFSSDFFDTMDGVESK